MREIIKYSKNSNNSSNSSNSSSGNSGNSSNSSIITVHRLKSGRSAGLDRLFIRTAASAAAHALFMLSVVLVSIGLFSYVQNESLLAVFLTGRDTRIELSEVVAEDWTDVKATPADEHPKLDRAFIRDGAPLLVPFYFVGDRIGTLSFPSVDHEVDVLQGDRETELRFGAGHYLSSYFPGQGHNILLAGHRTTHFKALQYLKTGESVLFETTYGIFTYRIDDIIIIKGGDNSIGGYSPVERLTIYTCYPFNYIGNAPKRYVLICSLTGSEIYR
ncbi:MAG: class D sortase [Saccharofermentanales bacterium]